ncbi:MAG: hypothetical protein ACSLEY_02325 [Candidatus Saccharimonadales bacterium]
MDLLSPQPIMDELIDFVDTPNAYRSVLILVLALVISYIASRFVTSGILKLIQIVGIKSDSIPNYEKRLRYRQLETYLSITVAVMRAAIVAIAAPTWYGAFLLHTPQAADWQLSVPVRSSLFLPAKPSV